MEANWCAHHCLLPEPARQRYSEASAAPPRCLLVLSAFDTLRDIFANALRAETGVAEVPALLLLQVLRHGAAAADGGGDGEKKGGGCK
jgi:hypothetical protein